MRQFCDACRVGTGGATDQNLALCHKDIAAFDKAGPFDFKHLTVQRPQMRGHLGGFAQTGWCAGSHDYCTLRQAKCCVFDKNAVGKSFGCVKFHNGGPGGPQGRDIGRMMGTHQRQIWRARPWA